MSAQTIATLLDGVAGWAETAVAPNLELLVPPEDGRVEDIEVETGHPAVYRMVVPGRERLTEGQRQAPSITVQVDGNDGLSGTRSYDVRLVLVTWSPGHFDAEGYHRGSDGWRDLCNGLDAIVEAVEAAETIAGCAVDMSRGVHFGPYREEGDVPDLYPYWMGKVDFTLAGAYPANKRYERYL